MSIIPSAQANMVEDEIKEKYNIIKVLKNKLDKIPRINQLVLSPSLFIIFEFILYIICVIGLMQFGIYGALGLLEAIIGAFPVLIFINLYLFFYVLPILILEFLISILDLFPSHSILIRS